jgi:hypothetical protein
VENPWKTVVYHHYPKLGVVCSTDDHFVFSLDAGRGPRPDVDEFRPLVGGATRIVRLVQLAADAGYDSERNHEFARDEHGIRTIIPAKHGRPTDKLPSGRYRRLMKVRFDREAYRRRSQVETVISMIKRRQGAHVHARSYHSQCRELRLLVLTHNIMILVVIEVFYRAGPDSPFNRRDELLTHVCIPGRRKTCLARSGVPLVLKVECDSDNPPCAVIDK